MSIEERSGRRGTKYRVRYPDPQRPGRWLSATFDSVQDARDFDALWKVKARGGALHELDAGRELLGDYILDEWLPVWRRDKSLKTHRECVRTINRYILEMNGEGWGTHSIAWVRLRQVDAGVIERWLHALEDRGVGVEARRKALYVLNQVFRRAVGHRDYPYANPVDAVDKPKAAARRKPTVFTPDKVEALRAALRHDLQSQTLVSLLAYAGLRPGEALALERRHYDGEKLTIDQRNSLGEVIEGAKSKTRPERTITLVGPLREDLDRWLERVGSSPTAPIFPARDGGYWNEWGYRNWRRRTFKPAVKRAGLDGCTPYTLRHVYISLRYKAGDNAIDVAAAAGHAPSLSQDYYAQSLEGVAGKKPINLVAEIRKARKRHGTDLRR